MGEIIKRYSNDGLTVIWQPAKCSHSENCAKGLSDVFNPDNRPWINPKGSDTDTIKKQVDLCPSGALSYEVENAEAVVAGDVEITASANGPLLVRGRVVVTSAQGKTVTHEKSTALCRCGASKNKPYCDGSHNQIEFSDA